MRKRIFGGWRRNGGSRDDRKTLFDIGRLLHAPRHENEAVIRGLCQNAYLGDDTALCRVLGRYKMFVDTRDVGVSSHLLLDGYWETWTTEAMLRFVRPGMTAVDVGANLGYFATLMADLVGPAGRVLAFEPNPPIADRLRKTIAVNGFTARTMVHELALGAEEGGAVLIVPPGEPKNAHVVAAAPVSGATMVARRRLDAIPEALDADFVKIDVEGAEEDVWRGMEGIFARGRPLTIFLEFTPGRYASPARFLDEILGHGFALAIIDLVRGVRPIGREAVLAGPPAEDQMLVLTR